MPRLLSILIAAAACCTSPTHADVLANARADFKQAYARVDAGASEAADRASLRQYVLYPYLQAARIRAELTRNPAPSEQVDDAAATFLKRHGEEPVSRTLRSAWLTSLAKRAQWSKFLDFYTPSNDDALSCFELTARIEMQRTDGLQEAIATRWLTPRNLSDCERPFAWLKEQGQLTPALIEQRARLALKENDAALAQRLAAELPAERATPIVQWAALIERPAREIDGLIAAPTRKVENDALLAGWSRLVRTDREGAHARFDRLVETRRLDPQAASPYALALALSLSWNRQAEALPFFERVAPEDFNEAALEWRARSALWHEQWSLAAKTIAAMPDAQRKHARWRYWAARAAEAMGDRALARQLYAAILQDDNFYSVMAAARLGHALTPHPEKLVADSLQLQQLGAQLAFVRARELFLLDMHGPADAEWRAGFESLPEDARRQAVHLAAQWGWHDRAIATAAQLRVFNDYELLYPRPFNPPVRSAAQLTRLPADLIYSVMRQESLFRTDAVSSAGARGLLQLLPETARRTARTWQRSTPQPADLLRAEVNIPLGAAYLRNLIDKFEGQTIVALAGYNAGPRAAARWLPAQSIEPDVWIENIPYNETRTYVQRILWHSVVFAWLRTGEPQRTQTWLARVAPVGEGEVLGSLAE